MNLLTAGTRLLGQLAEAQHFDLQRMALVLAVGGFAARRRQALAGVCISGFGPAQRGFGFFADQQLRAQAFFQVVNVLRAGQQASLRRIRRIKTHAVGADGMAAHDINRLARLQAFARRQRVVQRGRGVAAVQPVAHQCRQAHIVQAQQISQRLEGERWVGSARRCGVGRRIKREFGRRAVLVGACVRASKTPHQLQPADFQRAQTLAQGGFQRVFPASLDMQAAPQPLQVFKAMPGQPGFQLAVGLDFFLQRLERFQPRRQVGAPG